ncbi:polycystin family receptor for egg jelly-like [Centruroides vittatus]|uniref:polycystin family receptor for egg jelly-like n=1 Tax=Centruroides vittatus TaxID=120091 RepID=UPI00350F1E06
MFRGKILILIQIFIHEASVCRTFTLRDDQIENGVTWKFDHFFLFGKGFYACLNSKNLFNVDKTYRSEGVKVCFWAAFFAEEQTVKNGQYSIIFIGSFVEGNISIIHAFIVLSDGSLQIIFTDNRRSVTASTKIKTIDFHCLYYYICYSVKITKGSIFDRSNHFEITVFGDNQRLTVLLGKPPLLLNPLGSCVGSDSHEGFLYWSLASMKVWHSIQEEESNLDICLKNPCSVDELCLPLPVASTRKCLCQSCVDSAGCYNGGTYISLEENVICICHPKYKGINCESESLEGEFLIDLTSQILFINETATIYLRSNKLNNSLNVNLILDNDTIFQYSNDKNCSSCIEIVHGPKILSYYLLPNVSEWDLNVTFTSEGIHYLIIETEKSIVRNLTFSVSERIKEIILTTKSHFGQPGHEIIFLLGVSNTGLMPEFIWKINKSEFQSELPESISHREMVEFFPSNQIPGNITKFVRQKWIFERTGLYNISVTAKATGRIDVIANHSIYIVSKSDMYKFYTNATIAEVNGGLSLFLSSVEDKVDTEYIFIVDNENISTQNGLSLGNSQLEVPQEYRVLTDFFHYANVTVTFNITKISYVGVIVKHKNEVMFEKIIEVAVVKKLCKPSVDILNAGWRSSESFVYLRKDPIVLRSITKFNCDIKTSPRWKWTLFDSFKNSTVIPLVSNLNYLSIPEKTLPYGAYAVKLVVKIWQMNRILSDEIMKWFNINSSRPVAKISGGIERIIDSDEDLILDGSPSYDPDFDNADMNFVWVCLKGECPFKHIEEKKTIVIIPKNNLKVSKYVISLTVNYQNRQSLPFNQEIEVLQGKFPIVSITCLSNCNAGVNPSEKFALKVNCKHCSAGSKFLWKMLSKEGNLKTFINWNEETLYGNSSKLLLIHPNVMKEGDSYLFTVTIEGANRSQAQYRVTIDEKPKVEKCIVKPEKGISLETLFTIECFGIYDKNMPIIYQFFFDNKLNRDKLLLRTSMYPKMIETILPIGNPHNNFEAGITVMLTNEVGTRTEVNLIVHVFPPVSSSDTVKRWLKDKKLDTILNSGDNEEVTVILESLSEILKNDSDGSHYGDELIDIINQLPLINTFSIKQSSHALHSLSQNDEEFSDESKVKLTKFVEKATESFLRFTKTQILRQDEKFNTAKSIYLSSSGVLRVVMGKKSNASVDENGVNYENYYYYYYQPSNTLICSLGSKIVNLTEIITDILMKEMIANDNYTSISSDSFDVFLQKYDEENATERNLANIIYISENIFGGEAKIKMMINRINPFICDENSHLINTDTLIVDVKRKKKIEDIKVDSFLRRTDRAKNTQSGKAEVILHNNRTTCDVTISIHRTIIPNNNFSMHLSLNVLTPKTSFLFTITNTKPTIVDFSKWHRVITYSKQDKYFINIPENVTKKGGVYFIGILPYSALSRKVLNLSRNVENRMEKKVSIEYNLDIFFTRCFSYNASWTDNGCHVGNNSTDLTLHCLCSHLSVFSGSYFVAPNTVDVTQTVVLLGTVTENSVVLICLIIIWTIYLVFLFWASRVDRKNAKNRIKIISSNHPESMYYYAILISTGIRKNSGTTSKVYIQLEGSSDKSQIILLTDPEEEYFKRGNEDRFIIQLDSDIGAITRVYVWHDNSGLNPSWLLDKIEIHDLNMNQTLIFPGRWLAVNKEDGQISTSLDPVDFLRYKVLFAKAFIYQFRDHHIWFSLFFSSPSSDFTRCQRVTCLLNILLASMLASIMFYGIDVADPRDQLEIRYFKFSLSEMIVGIQSSILAFFVGIIMAGIFRNIRNEKALKYTKSFPISSVMDTTAVFLREKFLPPWFIYIAWFITLATSLIYTYFILLYGLTYGYERSMRWLASIFTSFFGSILVLQPGKAIIFAAFIAYLLAKKSKQLKINQRKKISKIDIPSDISQKELHHYRYLKNKESIILSILSDSFLFICFTIAIQTLAHHNRSHMAYFSNIATKHTFIQGAYGGIPLTDVTSLQLLKKYLNTTLINGMHKEKWYNGEKMENGYIADGFTLLIGVARLRQVRVKYSHCSEQMIPLKSYCFLQYSLSSEDNRNYRPSWIRGMAIPAYTKKPTPWMFRTAEEIKTDWKFGEINIYSGNGYVALLGRRRKSSRSKLKHLLDRNWIDSRTRAIFVDVTTYNANNNIFNSINLIFEISGIGNVIPSYNIRTSNFDIFVQTSNLQAGISEVACFILISLFTYREAKSLYKLKMNYFTKFWNIFELILLCFGYVFIAVTIKQTLGISGLWKKDEELEYVSFESAAKWDEIFLIIQSILVTLTTMKLWKILSFIQAFKLPYGTLKIAYKSIAHFTLMLFLLMISIMSFCVIKFGKWVKNMRNLLQTMYSLMNYALGEIEYEELLKVDKFLGPLFTFVFVVVVSWLFLTLIISILIDSFHTTLSLKKKEESRLEVTNYIYHQFKILFRKTSISWIEHVHKKRKRNQDERRDDGATNLN